MCVGSQAYPAEPGVLTHSWAHTRIRNAGCAPKSFGCLRISALSQARGERKKQWEWEHSAAEWVTQLLIFILMRKKSQSHSKFNRNVFVANSRKHGSKHFRLESLLKHLCCFSPETVKNIHAGNNMFGSLVYTTWIHPEERVWSQQLHLVLFLCLLADCKPPSKVHMITSVSECVDADFKSMKAICLSFVNSRTYISNYWSESCFVTVV